MEISALQKWLAEPRTALITAVAEGIRAHVDMLRSQGIEFYGYALLLGKPYDIRSLVAVTNTEGDIKTSSTDGLYNYYRYSVDEWANWNHDEFAAANALLVEANESFKSMHSKTAHDYTRDQFEVAHANALLDSIVRGLEAAKADCVFGGSEPFLVVWISDSDHEILVESARRLNSAAMAEEFIREFE